MATDTTQCFGKFYIVQAGDTCWGISQKNNITVSEIQMYNPNLNCNNLQIGQKICVERAPAALNYYSVKSGDTCWNIAKQNSISEEQLLKYNPGLKCDNLQINQAVYLAELKSAPAAAAGGGTTTTTTTTSAPAAAAGGGTTTTTTSAPAAGRRKDGDFDISGLVAVDQAYKAGQVAAAGGQAPQTTNTYNKGGVETVEWIYTDDQNDPRCMTNWKYSDAEGNVLQDKIERTTMYNSDRRWCATNSSYISTAARQKLAPLAPLNTCVDFDGNYKLTDSQGNPIKEANELSECQGIQSYNGKYKFVLQSDGNAVLYDNTNGKAAWASNDYGGLLKTGTRPYKLIFDGNDLKIVDSSPNKVTLYTQRGVNGNKLYLNNRGGLSSANDDVGTTGNIINNKITSDTKYADCKWRDGTNESAESKYKKPTKTSLKKGEILFQCEGLVNGKVMLYINSKDGKLSLVNEKYTWNNREIESTKNSFSGDRPWPAFLIFQQDNNLVFYDGDNNVLWNKWLPNYEGKVMINPSGDGSLVYVPIDTPDDFDFDFLSMYRKGNAFLDKYVRISLSS